MFKTVFQVSLIAASCSGVFVATNAFADCSPAQIAACVQGTKDYWAQRPNCNNDSMCPKDACVAYMECINSCCSAGCEQNIPNINPLCNEGPKLSNKRFNFVPKAPLKSK